MFNLSPHLRIRLAAIARIWLLAGSAMLALEPGLRGVHPLFGWLPYWLLCAPLLVLAQCRAGQLLARRWTLRRSLADLLQRRRRQARYRQRPRSAA